MRRFRSPIWMVLSFLLIAPLIASTQFSDCAEIVKTALDATKDICSSTSRNQACYGHVMLDAQAQPGLGPLQFSKVGDRVNLTQLDSLRLSPMDTTNGTWGVALVKLQADIPTEQVDNNVSLLLFGDVEVRNAILNPITMNVSVAGKRNVNVRRQPNNQAFVMTTLRPGDAVVADGRSEDNTWVSVTLPDNGGEGWVSASLIQADGDLTTLNVKRVDLEGYGPMQAFYLETGENHSSCAEASNDGILIQTPEGVAEVRLWINEVRIRLGSTAFISAQPNGQMNVKTVEGQAHVEAFGVEQAVPAGTGVTVQMNANLAPSAPPSRPQAYKTEDVANLPVQNLEREIEVAPPMEVTDEPTSLIESPTPLAVSTEGATAVEGQVGEPPTETPIVLSLTPETEKGGGDPPIFPPTDTPEGG